MSTLISVVGARPNFMKAAPVRHAFDAIPDIRHLMVHTGQHYDANMSDVFFEDLGMGKPDMYLGIGSGSHAEQTAKVMVEFEKICLAEHPEMVIVYGDVNSTMAAAIVAKKLNLPVAHVEAGLRSNDRGMPEELNRVLTDSIADLYFVTEESGRQHLLREGADMQRIHLVGNTMIDSLARLCEKLGTAEQGEQYFVLTLHRPSNVDDPAALRQLVQAIVDGAGEIPIRFPVHPRTEAVLRSSGLYQELEANPQWQLIPPAGYREFIELVRGSIGVITDSGGIQEETTWLGIPCVTLRETTERPSTIELGTNTLVGVLPVMVRNAITRIRTSATPNSAAQNRTWNVPPLWDGQAAQRIVRIILQVLQSYQTQENTG